MSKLILLLALALPVPALAQDAPRVEVSAGYAYARASEVEPARRLRRARRLARRARSASSSPGSLQSGSVDGTDVDRTTLLAGPRFVWRRGGVTPFVHALGGIVRDEQRASTSSTCRSA